MAFTSDMAEATREPTGGCLCGRVQWRVSGPLKAITACHCTQCRRTSGHYAAFTGASLAAVEITGGENVTWYQSSAEARRGFCTTCGSMLFWRPEGEDRIAIAAGSINGASGLSIAKHIYCHDKGDYYDITDGAPQEAAH